MLLRRAPARQLQGYCVRGDHTKDERKDIAAGGRSREGLSDECAESDCAREDCRVAAPRALALGCLPLAWAVLRLTSFGPASAGRKWSGVPLWVLADGLPDTAEDGRFVGGGRRTQEEGTQEEGEQEKQGEQEEDED